MDTPVERKDFGIEDWIVRPRRSIIERGNKSVHIKPKSMAVLECLASSNGEVVSREELFDVVWPGVVVSDDTLTQCIVELRKAFGDTARDAQFIETIPKIGFRLLPAVLPAAGNNDSEEAQGFGKPPLWRSPVLLIPVLGAFVVGILLYWFQFTTLPERNQTLQVEDNLTLAVLPFIDLSPDQDQEYFADGLSEELLNRLGRLEDLRVTGRTSAFYFKGKDVGMEQIAAALEVGHILEGSIRKSGAQLRITAKLLDTSNGFQLWSETYNRHLEDIFIIEDEIAESVAAALSITLGVGKLGQLEEGTNSVEAYNELLKGNAQYRKFSRESLPISIDHFIRAIELDPNYALAHSRLADVYTTARLILDGDLRENWVALSGQAIERALEIAPDSLEVLETAAFRLTHMRRWKEANLAFARAEEAGEARAINMSTFLIQVGRGRDALDDLQREARLDPLSGITAIYLSQIYRELGRAEDAIAEDERAFELNNYRGLVIGHGTFTAITYKDQTEIRKWLDRSSDHSPALRELNNTMMANLDNPEAALEYLSGIFEDSPMNYGKVAAWAAFHGDFELALQARRRLGTVSWGTWSPLDAGVRKLPGFKDIVREAGLVDYWREFGWGYYCHPVGEDDFECE